MRLVVYSNEGWYIKEKRPYQTSLIDGYEYCFTTRDEVDVYHRKAVFETGYWVRCYAKYGSGFGRVNFNDDGEYVRHSSTSLQYKKRIEYQKALSLYKKWRASCV